MAFANAFRISTSDLTACFIPRNCVCYSRVSACPSSPVVMKSKREKRTRSNDDSTTSSTSFRTHPPRIDMESSTLSLRQQLKLARAATESPTTPRVRQRFRRKKVADFRSGRTQPEDDIDLPDGKYMLECDPLLFVDAYNVIGAWPKLRKHRDRMDMETARRLLVDAVTEFSHIRGWECVLVFDAQGNDNAERTDVTAQNVQLVYTGAETADTYIERQVYEWCERGSRQVWAATSDVAQLNFSESKGAHVMTSKFFVQEIKRALNETKERVEEKDGMAARGRMLMSNVDEETRQRLLDLRDRLDGR